MLVQVHSDLGQGGRHTGRHHVSVVARSDPAVVAQDVQHREVRDRASVREAAPLQKGDALARQAAAELVQQAGLAHPRLPDHADGAAPALTGVGEGLSQGSDLGRPTDEVAHRPGTEALERRAARPGAEHPIGLDRRSLAAQRHPAERLQPDVPLHQRCGRRTEEDLPRLRERLQSRSDVQGVADRRHLRLLPHPNPRHHDRPCVEPHPDLRTLGAGHLQRGPLPLQAAAQGHRDQHSPMRMVLVTLGGADQGHDAVAQESAHRAAVATHLLVGDVEELPHEAMHGLGSDPLGQAGGADHVAEEHGDLAVLALGARGWPREARVGAERRSAPAAETLPRDGGRPAAGTRPRHRRAALLAVLHAGTVLGAATGTLQGILAQARGVHRCRASKTRATSVAWRPAGRRPP